MIGVFVPELARSVLTSVFPFAIILLILIWLVGHVMQPALGLGRGAVAAAGSASPFVTPEEVVVATAAGPAARREHAPPPVESPPPGKHDRGDNSADDAHSEGGQGDA